MAGNGLNTYAIRINDQAYIERLSKRAKHIARHGFRFVVVTDGLPAHPSTIHAREGDHPLAFDDWARRTVIDELHDLHVAEGPHKPRDRKHALQELDRAEFRVGNARKALQAAEADLEQTVREVVRTHGVSFERNGETYDLRYNVDSEGKETVYLAVRPKHPRFSKNGLDTV